MRNSITRLPICMAFIDSLLIFCLLDPNQPKPFAVSAGNEAEPKTLRRLVKYPETATLWAGIQAAIEAIHRTEKYDSDNPQE